MTTFLLIVITLLLAVLVAIACVPIAVFALAYFQVNSALETLGDRLRRCSWTSSSEPTTGP